MLLRWTPQIDTRLMTPCFLDKMTGSVYVVEIPDAVLTGVCGVHIQSTQDLDRIPANTPGAYWIGTDEPISHCFHSGFATPRPFEENGSMIVYSGSSCNLRSRAKQHLLRSNEGGGFGTMSGVSVDILLEEQQPRQTKLASHTKYLWSSSVKNKKIPKVLNTGHGGYSKISSKTDIFRFMTNISGEEARYISEHEDIRFKNGIHVQEEKHRPYKWVFWYMPILNHSIRDFIEIEWRRHHGIPVLCSYKEGR